MTVLINILMADKSTKVNVSSVVLSNINILGSDNFICNPCFPVFVENFTNGSDKYQ